MKQAAKQGKKNQIGAFGEQITCTYLRKRDFAILATNYLKKWGEIDIVAQETLAGAKIIHFVEVKTVSYGTKAVLEASVSQETWRPEDNVHYRKLQRLHRTIESWLLEHHCDHDWQIDIAIVRIVVGEKYATVKYIPNIITD